jgi:hypothetical protein
MLHVRSDDTDMCHQWVEVSDLQAQPNPEFVLRSLFHTNKVALYSIEWKQSVSYYCGSDNSSGGET